METEARLEFDRIDLAASQIWNGSGRKIVGPMNVNGQTVTLKSTAGSYWESRDVIGTGHVMVESGSWYPLQLHFSGSISGAPESIVLGGDHVGATAGDIDVHRPCTEHPATGYGRLYLDSSQVGNVTMYPGTSLDSIQWEGAPAAPSTHDLTFIPDRGATSSFGAESGLTVTGSVSLGNAISFDRWSDPSNRQPYATGVVSFWDGNVRLGTVPLDSGARSMFTLSLDKPGITLITAIYEGSPIHVISADSTYAIVAAPEIPTLGTFVATLLAATIALAGASRIR